MRNEKSQNVWGDIENFHFLRVKYSCEFIMQSSHQNFTEFSKKLSMDW